MDHSMGREEVNPPDQQEYRGWEAKNNKDADLKLISSDDKVFWVQSSVLAQYS